MASVIYRPDYAKFVIEAEPDRWQHLYRAFVSLQHERKYGGDFLTSHRTSRLWYDAASGKETWSLEVWGEWTQLVLFLPAAWIAWLRRFDVRAVVWDASEDAVLAVGQRLQQSVTRYNINVYSTRPATKRNGRDRGGKGFAVGSHKSDLRVTVYKRTGEPVAQEFQCTGTMLRRLVERVKEDRSFNIPDVTAWGTLIGFVKAVGLARLGQALDLAGIGQYWPIYREEDPPSLPRIQGSFAAELNAEDDLENWDFGRGAWLPEDPMDTPASE